MSTSLNEYFTERLLHWISTSLSEYLTDLVLHRTSTSLNESLPPRFLWGSDHATCSTLKRKILKLPVARILMKLSMGDFKVFLSKVLHVALSEPQRKLGGQVLIQWSTHWVKYSFITVLKLVFGGAQVLQNRAVIALFYLPFNGLLTFFFSNKTFFENNRHI